MVSSLLFLSFIYECVCLPTFPGLGNLALVAELLSQAEWAVLKSPDCGHAVHHRLHRSLGRLHVATGNLDAALRDFANDVRTSVITFGSNGSRACINVKYLCCRCEQKTQSYACVHFSLPQDEDSLYVHLVWQKKKKPYQCFFQIYFASEEYGLDSTVTCGGYFLMANVFAKQGKMPVACSLYSEVN